VKTIGLTGGIGSGKTTVAALLEKLGATVIHADAVGHEVYQPHTVGWQRVTEAFGTAILQPDGTIDRKQLGAMVFNDPAALKRLNAIVHPLIYAEVERRIKAHRATGSTQTVVVEAAILIEANWLPLVDEVWLVTASKDLVVERIERQRGLASGAVAARIAAQLGDTERRKFAQVIIENTGTIADLTAKVRAAWEGSIARSS